MNSLKTGILITTLTLLLASCALDMGQGARYGAYGGPARERQPEPPFSIEDTYRGKRWFPTHVRYAPDGTHLLVSLCHVKRPALCRIGKYFIETKEWEILPFEDKRTYRWPVYHPDGKEMAVVSTPCDENYHCGFGGSRLVRMKADGTEETPLGDVIASLMSFSPDGRKLIYWRHGPIYPQGRRTSGGGTDIFELDWATGKERRLTDLSFSGAYEGRPLFVDNGEAFVFYAQFEATYWASASNSGMNYVRIADKPLGRDDMRGMKLIWPKMNEDRTGLVGWSSFDVSRDGRLLYYGGFGWRQRAGDPVSVAILPYRPFVQGQKQYDTQEDSDLAGASAILYLRQPRAGARDEVAFRVDKPFDAALSPDAKRVAFLDGGSPVSSAGVRLGLIDQGPAQHPISIDWPKLELKPGRQTVAKH